MKSLLLKNFSVPCAALPELPDPDSHLRPLITKQLNLKDQELSGYDIAAKSLDARKKGHPLFIYTLVLQLDDHAATPAGCEIMPPLENRLCPERFAASKAPINPVVVGSGPAGLLAAWMLALNGRKPLVIDRGFDVDTRTRDLESFFSSRHLNPDSNFLIGEGGAGTYSDGKLYTRIRDPRISLIIELFVKCGAPQEIRYLKRPHIGSDLLPPMVAAIRREIEALGGGFKWGTEVTGIISRNGQCLGVKLADGSEITAPAVFMAFGLGARELTRSLIRGNIAYALKGFQLGPRIEHPQEMIDRNQLGIDSRPPSIDPVEYNFVSKTHPSSHIPGVSTFCMCPGGEIIPATARESAISTNGMSRYRRDQEFANSCLISTFHPDADSNPDDIFAMIEKLESDAFTLGGGDYSVPAQDAQAFLNGSRRLNNNRGSYRFGMTPARIDTLLPEAAVRGVKNALTQFDRQCPGFIRHGKLVGIETHVSSPVRFLRQDGSMLSSLNNLYIIGEGAGFAGGIISAAADGMKAAEHYLGGDNV